MQIKNIPTGAGDVINMQAVYTDGATRYNLQSLAAVSYSMFGGTNTPGAYQSIGFANAPDAVYTGTSAANGTGLENVRTWGFRGGYTHNWDPYWNTGIYGAYAAIQYGSNGKAVICANAVALLALVGTCNPDFNIAQAGIITRWTPVKNLTFSGDFTWTRIDQKYSGTVVAPTLACGRQAGRRVRVEGSGQLQLPAPRSAQLLIRIIRRNRAPRQATAGGFFVPAIDQRS